MEVSKLTKPVVVTISGAAYLAVVEESEGKITLNNALHLGSPHVVAEAHLKDYVAAAYSNKLQTIEVSSATPWFKQELSEELLISWEIVKLKMDRAIKVAPVQTVVDFFNKS